MNASGALEGKNMLAFALLWAIAAASIGGDVHNVAVIWNGVRWNPILVFASDDTKGFDIAIHNGFGNPLTGPLHSSSVDEWLHLLVVLAHCNLE